LFSGAKILNRFFSLLKSVSRYLKGSEPTIRTEAYSLVDQIETRNLDIVGAATYSTSMQNGRQDVRNATAKARDVVELIQLSGTPQAQYQQLADRLETCMEPFNKRYWDPDGIGAGTLRDIIIAFEKKAAEPEDA
jgi:hypothetical protein